jgi:FkbM family methyltransferase
VDVGANVGALALPVAVCRPDARIVCIEADPEIVSLLGLNVTENGRSNISIIHCLAGPIDDPQVSFYRAPTAKFGMGSIGPQFEASPVKLPQRPLDAILDELAIENVDIVKLDIEGAELGALQGLIRRLTSLHQVARGGTPGDRIEHPITVGFVMIMALPPLRTRKRS